MTRTVSIVTSVWNDLTRPPLRGVDLTRDLQRWGWHLSVHDEVESTQSEVIAAARSGAPEGTVVLAEFQSAGRGRRDRQWVSPARAGITMSILFRPPQPTPWWGIIAALGTANAIRNLAEADVRLKWPNDLLLNDQKLAGVISEVEGSAVVVGIGVNVSTRRDELPVAQATSLALEGFEIDRSSLIKEILRSVRRLADLELTAVRAEYESLLDTIGREVLVHGVHGETRGRAQGIDADGHLIVDGQSFSVGDVIHLR